MRQGKTLNKTESDATRSEASFKIENIQFKQLVRY